MLNAGGGVWPFQLVGFSGAIFIYFLVTCFLRTLKMAYGRVKNVNVSEFRHFYRLSVEKILPMVALLSVINAP